MGCTYFYTTKENGDVRILTDFRRLNAVLKRKMAIDLSMGYYHIPLDDESAWLCTTILPWGKYQYQKLPMGIKNSPDIFQSIMNDIFHDLGICLTVELHVGGYYLRSMAQSLYMFPGRKM
jgi:hypothetical protein